MKLPPMGCYDGKGQSYGVHIFYGIKGIIIVFPMDLPKTFGNWYFLIPTHMSICYLLGLVDPFASDNMLS
jgi:hypothetical protein